MLQRLYEFSKQLLTLKSQVEKNTQDIKELRQDLKELTAATQKLAYAVERERENNPTRGKSWFSASKMRCSR